MNALDEALRYLRFSVNIFAAVDDHRRLAQARFVEANVLFEQGEIEAAQTLWLEVAPILEAGKNRHSLASLWLNLGWCALEQREPDSARTWLKLALDRFSQIRSATDMARVRWALALVDARHGDRAAGLRALKHERENLEKLGLAIEAGIVGLDIAEILLLDPATNGEGVAVCRQLVPLFERAGANKELSKAIALGRSLPA